MNKITKNEILNVLHLIDKQLQTEQRLVLCGSSSIILQGYDFRNTFDIDLASLPTAEVQYAIQKTVKAAKMSTDTIDFNSIGVAQLLYDYEDRLIKIEDNFIHLQVYVLSKMDWVVSKLNSPKFDDLINYDLVTVKDLNEAKKNMHKYSGINDYKALYDLDLAISYLKEKEENNIKGENEMEC